MTSMVNRFTVATLNSNSYDHLSTTIGVISIFLLVALLILREAMRILGGARRDTWTRTLDIATAPLLIAFSALMLARLLELVYRYFLQG